MRYDGSNYFWVMTCIHDGDASDEARMNGHDLSSFKDPKGKALL